MRTLLILMIYGIISGLSSLAAQSMEKAVDLLNQGKYEAAVEQFRRLWEADSSNVEALRLAGYASKEEGNIPRAIHFYRQVLHHLPEDYDARLALARLYVAQDELDSARVLYLQILQQDTTDVEAWWGLADIYLWQGELKQAEWCARKAAHFLPENVQSYFRLARIYIAADRLKEAREAYLRINEIDPTYAESWAGLGKLAWWQDQPFRALRYYARAQQLDPTNPEYQQKLRQIEQEVGWRIASSGTAIQEAEEFIDYQSYRMELRYGKRLNDRWEVQVRNSRLFLERFLPASNTRSFRDYDQQSVALSWHGASSQWKARVDYSFLDQELKDLEVGGRLDVNSHLRLYLTGNYHFFYAWEDLFARSLQTALRYRWWRFTLSGNVRLGEILQDRVYDENGLLTVKDNRRLLTSASLRVLLYKPFTFHLILGYNYSDHQYVSPYHYTPQQLVAYSLGASFYREWKMLYLYGEGMFGSNSDQVDQTVASLEGGFLLTHWGIGINLSYFHNPYYENLTGQLALKVRL